MIKINEQYYINADTNCYILKERKKIQDENSKNYGELVYRDLGYYVSLEQLLNGLMKKELRKFIAKDTENSIKDLVAEIKKLKEFIKSLNIDI